MRKACGIYRIVRLDTGREYIGHSCDIGRRWADHRRLLNAGSHHASKLQRAWSKYGQEAFAFEIIEFCDRAALVEREQWHFDERKPWFNTAPAAGSRLGVPQSPETREKIRAGIAGHIKSNETRRRLSAALTGRKLTAEHCAKIREAKSKPSDETRAKLSAARKGKTASAETRAKMSAAQKGRVLSAEQRARMSAAQKGRKFTDEHREKLRTCNKRRGFQHSEETKQKMREAALRRYANQGGAQ